MVKIRELSALSTNAVAFVPEVEMRWRSHSRPKNRMAVFLLPLFLFTPLRDSPSSSPSVISVLSVVPGSSGSPDHLRGSASWPRSSVAVSRSAAWEYGLTSAILITGMRGGGVSGSRMALWAVTSGELNVSERPAPPVRAVPGATSSGGLAMGSKGQAAPERSDSRFPYLAQLPRRSRRSRGRSTRSTRRKSSGRRPSRTISRSRWRDAIPRGSSSPRSTGSSARSTSSSTFTAGRTANSPRSRPSTITGPAASRTSTCART